MKCFNILIQVYSNKNTYTYLDTSDENTSNWMMFIRTAETYSEQNLVAYQHNGCIYFSAIKVCYVDGY